MAQYHRAGRGTDRPPADGEDGQGPRRRPVNLKTTHLYPQPYHARHQSQAGHVKDRTELNELR